MMIKTSHSSFAGQPRPAARGHRLACWLCTVVAVALTAAAIPVLSSTVRADEPASTAEAMSHATALSKAFRHAAEAATPTVVVVRSETKARKPAAGRRQPGRGQRPNPFQGTPLEEMFPDGLPEGLEFNMPEGSGRPPRSGVGSGVIVDPAGVVLTNNHVVEGADEVTVELSDGREFKAAEIKTDPDSDLAVVRLAGAKDLPTARLGDSDKLSIGDWVIAIGTPFELETTVSAGIISGKGRELGGIRRAQFLQTDAAINPGNSGGPLVNLAGEVVGINTAIASNSGGYQGIGFAIPVNLAKWVSSQLISKGKVERAFMGVQMGPLDMRTAAKLGVKDHRKGVLVSDVVPGSPAAEAGVQELDVITSFDDQPVAGTRSLQEIVERATIGQPHKLTVLRDGKVLTLTVAVKPLPTDLAAGDRGRPRAGAAGPWVVERVGGGGGAPRPARGPTPPPPRPGGGARARPRSGDADAEGETFYSKEFGLEVREKGGLEEDVYEGFTGVLVDRVDEDGVAAASGLGPGMLIRGVGRTEVKSIAEFAAALEKASADEGVWIKVRTPRGNIPLLLQRK